MKLTFLPRVGEITECLSQNGSGLCSLIGEVSGDKRIKCSGQATTRLAEEVVNNALP